MKFHLKTGFRVWKHTSNDLHFIQIRRTLNSIKKNNWNLVSESLVITLEALEYSRVKYKLIFFKITSIWVKSLYFNEKIEKFNSFFSDKMWAAVWWFWNDIKMQIKVKIVITLSTTLFNSSSHFLSVSPIQITFLLFSFFFLFFFLCFGFRDLLLGLPEVWRFFSFLLFLAGNVLSCLSIYGVSKVLLY